MNEINLESIKTETDYEKALSEIDKVFDAEEGTPEAHPKISSANS